MLKLRKYFAPWAAIILLVIGLLFLQANLDLALPDYLSKIVNIGIMQGGVDTAIPDQMRISTFNAMKGAVAMNQTGGSVNLDSLYEKGTKPGISGDIMILTAGGRDKIKSDAELKASVIKAFVYGSMIQAQKSGDIEAMMTSMGNMGGSTTVTAPAGGQAISQQEQLKMFQNLLNEETFRDQISIRLVGWEYQQLGMNTAQMRSNYILHIGVIMLILALMSAATTITVGYFGARISAGVAHDIRRDLFTRVESFSAAEIDKFSTGSLITRNTNDITQVQTVTFFLVRMALYAPIMGVGGVIRAVGKAPSMAWLIGLAVLVLFGLVMIVMSIALPKFRMIQKLTDRLNKVAREQLSGIMVVRAFNRQDFEKERFHEANRDVTDTSLFVMRVMVVMMPMIMLIMNGLTVAIVWVGADKINNASMQIGNMMAFLQYAIQIVMSFLMLSMVFIFLPRATVSARRIHEVLSTEPSIVDPEEGTAEAPPINGDRRGRLEFRNVNFCYPGADEDALKNISFIAEPGQTTAIIGSTGSGKSSLVNLIPRFYDVCDGEILLDGHDIRKYRQNDLRSMIGYVPQKSALFSGTIDSNLRFGAEDTDAQWLEKAADIAQAGEFIRAKESGFDEPISQGGGNVSGGQKQRLSIARAIMTKAPVLIFDDSFSALDFKTDAALRRALQENIGDSTRIIVAQRVSTIMRAEQILVLEDGKLVGKGTHDELMQDCKEYREIALSQLSIQEVS